MSYSITPATSLVGEAGGVLVFTITRPTATSVETLFVSTAPNLGFANSGDYKGLLNVEITFGIGETSRTVSLTLSDDFVVEGNENFGIILQQNASDPVDIFLAQNAFTIVDNDSPTGVTYSIVPLSQVFSENAGTLTFTITRSSGALAETVYVSTTPNLGFANSGDYSGLLDKQVTFAAGQTSQTVTITINDDTIFEPDESFGIIVQRNTSDPVSTYLAWTSFTIDDNDTQPPGGFVPVALNIYPAAGFDNIGQGNQDNDDSHAPGTARQWAYDFLTPNLTNVQAVTGGVVVAVRQDLTGDFRGYGNVVTILHDGGFYATYAHLTAFSAKVTAGMRVEAGQPIAQSGGSGSFDGVALHPNLHIQFGTSVSLLNANFSNANTATLIADGSAGTESPAYFPKLTIHFDQRADDGLSTDTNYTGMRGIDDFYGNSSANIVDGLAGNDILRGMGGNDVLRGGDGDDTLDGGYGSDTMLGGKGNDAYTVDSAGDVIGESLGEGIDTVSSAISYTLGANVENLTLTGVSSVNGSGNSLNNTIIGNAAANSLLGADGNDDLAGGAGSDTIGGGNGLDQINGGAGRDFLTGGAGADVFVFSSLGDTAADRRQCDVIADFVFGVDKIDVSLIDAQLSSAGTLEDFVLIGTSSFTAEGQIRAIQSGGNTILQLNVLGILGVDMSIVLTDVRSSTLSMSDFIT